VIQAVTAAVIWGLVLCLLPGARTRKDHSILVAAVAIATALTLNVDPIYLAGDRALGGHNLLDLFANILMVVGIYFLSQAILRAAELAGLAGRPDGDPGGRSAEYVQLVDWGFGGGGTSVLTEGAGRA
jgi:hypothetical protein